MTQGHISPSAMSRVLIANRGEIARRLAVTTARLDLHHVWLAPRPEIGPPIARSKRHTISVALTDGGNPYLKADLIVALAQATNCDAVHPGYGFLAESPKLANACENAGVCFIGPSASVLVAASDKVQMRAIAKKSGVQIVDGSEILDDLDHALSEAKRIGYPVALKAAGGGGGVGITPCKSADDLRGKFGPTIASAESAFDDGRVYLERWLPAVRHVEVQLVADNRAQPRAIHVRDCSTQRRNQKMIEESLTIPRFEAHGEELAASAEAIGRAIALDNIATVEFLLDTAEGKIYFLEVNPRLQVEHTVTEASLGLDLVQLQIEAASGQRLEPASLTSKTYRAMPHAIQCRITSEDPHMDFRPNVGTISCWSSPVGPFVRLDTHCSAGTNVTPSYDSLLAKLVTWGDDRESALAAMRAALAMMEIGGIATNVPFLTYVISHPNFAHDRHLVSSLKDEWLPEFVAWDGTSL